MSIPAPDDPRDPMQMLAPLLLLQGCMQPLLRLLSAPQAGAAPPEACESCHQPSDSVERLLMLLLMESFFDSMGDPFA